MTAARTASAGSYRPLDDGVTVMPRGLVAVHVRLRLADGAEERRPRPELDVAHLVELFAGGRGQLATAARLERFQHLPIVVELRRSVAVRAREVRHPAGRHHGHALWTRSEDLAERPPPVVASARRRLRREIDVHVQWDDRHRWLGHREMERDVERVIERRVLGIDESETPLDALTPDRSRQRP